MPAIYSDVSPVKFRVVRSKAGMLWGTARVQTPSGPVWVIAASSEATVRRLLLRLYRKWLRQGEGGSIDKAISGAISGGFFGKLFKRLKRVALNPFKTLGRVAKRLVKGDIMGALKAGVKGALGGGPLGLIPGASKFAERTLGGALKMAGKLAPLAAMVPGFGMVAAPLIQQSARILQGALRRDPQALGVLRTLRRARHRHPSVQRQFDLFARLLPRIRAGATAGSIVDDLNAEGPVSERWPTAAQGDDGGANGSWTTARDGSPVFVPAAYSGCGTSGYATIMSGPVWEQLRPHTGYRDEASTFGTRDAYAAGLSVLARAR